jgi:hypothetical protein
MEPQLVPAKLATGAPGDSLLDALSAQRAHLREFTTAQRRRLDDLQAQLAEQTRSLAPFDRDPALAELQQALQQAQRERDNLAGQVAEHEQRKESLLRDMDELRRANERLAQENAGLQAALAEQPPQGAGAEAGAAELPDDERQELEDLRRRYEMALDDLRAERSRCRELEAKVAHGGGAAAAGGGVGGSDWESQKQRLLAALSADFDEDDEEERRQRLEMEEVIRRTDAAIAANQEVISDLQKRLEEQTAGAGAMALGAAAVAAVLDRDEIIRQERANLEALQSEWREKVRTAEVEISMQRAKLARHQAQLDERSQELEASLRRTGPPESLPAKKDKFPGGRWLRRLGLKGGDDE